MPSPRLTKYHSEVKRYKRSFVSNSEVKAEICRAKRGWLAHFRRRPFDGKTKLSN